MTHRVFLVAEAERDIGDIYRHIAVHDSPEKAEHVFSRLMETCEALSSFPGRGHIPPELEDVGVYGYREVRFKPYRIVYEVDDKDVFIYCVLDGRRSLRELLERRLLR